MKNLKIKTLFGSVLGIFGLVCVPLALAQEATSTSEVVATTTSTEVEVVSTSTVADTSTNEVVATTTEVIATSTVVDTSTPAPVPNRGVEKVLRESGHGYMPPAFSNSSLNRPADWKELKKGTSTDATSTLKLKHEERREKQVKDRLERANQNIEKISERLGVLGEKIKAVVEDQASSTEIISEAMAKSENRGVFAKFIFGADYKSLGNIVSEGSKAQARIAQIEREIAKIATTSDKTALLENLQDQKDQIAELEQYVKDNINKFSLFGWIVQKFNM
jgi:hypothetical protein